MAKIFLSHSKSDKKIARQLARDLEAMEHEVWFDEWEIFAGDQLVSAINRGTQEADVILLLISARSVASGWVESEWLPKFVEEIEHRQLHIIPVRLDDTPVPRPLRERRYADLRGRYVVGIRDLSLALQPPRHEAGVARVYSDFATIDPGDWHRFLGQAAALDLFVMYASTWRNTYRKDLEELLQRPGGNIRVVLPSTGRSGAAPHLIAVYASRLGISVVKMRERVDDAAADFKDLEATSGAGSVEVYSTAHSFQHALYVTDTQCIVALYALCGERIPTPALLLSQGLMADFVRRDFAGIVASETGVERLA